MALPDDETVRYRVELDAGQATQQLKNLLGGINNLKETIKLLASSSGASFSQVGAYLKQLYAAQVSASGATKQMGAELKKAFNQQTNQAVKQLSQEMKEAEKSGKGFHSILHLIRGTLVAIGVFRVFNFIEESIRKAIETAKEFETSLYRLGNVERILSESGIETSVEGLRKGIQEIKKELPIFSEADITQQVSLIGIMTKELGVTEQQVIDIAKAIGVLNIRSAETEDLMTTTNKVLTAIVAPSGRGIASLGLDFGEANIEAVAFKNNVLKAGESFKDLTDHEKDMIKIAILLENTGQELETVQKFLETNTGALAELDAEWEDTLRMAGQALLSLLAAASPFIIGFLEFLQDGINGLKAFLVILQAVKDSFFGLVSALSTFTQDPLGFIKNYKDILGGVGDIFEESLKEGFQKFFTGQIPEDAPEWFRRLFEGFVEDADTATSSLDRFGDSIESIEELEGFDDLAKDLEKLQDRAEELNEDFDIDQKRKEFDYLRDVERLQQDFAIKRQRIIEDSNQKIADANRKYHNNQIDDEARFQEQLRQLREKFLFNLEDALRERDARQVLRLQRQYQMDKTALENEHALRQKEQDRQHQEDLQRIKDDRDDRLAELAEEERIRLERERQDYELKKQREEEDHARDMEDLKEKINDRLMEFAKAIGEEYDLNEEGVNAIYELLQQYYGPNGYFDGLYDYSYKSMVARAEQMLATINAIVQQANVLLRTETTPTIRVEATDTGGTTGSRQPTKLSTRKSIGSQAQGGTYLASQPTSAIFGEAGPEIASFIPVSKLKTGAGAGASSGLGALSGLLELDISLSPDLEGRIVRNTMSETAKVVMKVRRDKG